MASALEAAIWAPPPRSRSASVSQNIPEGLAIALPLRHGGMSRGRAFFWGQLSAVVEPAAGVIGAALVLTSAEFLPYGMAAAAGAMLYVVVEELIPETVRSGTPDVATLGFIGGFAAHDGPRQRSRVIESSVAAQGRRLTLVVPSEDLGADGGELGVAGWFACQLTS